MPNVPFININGMYQVVIYMAKDHITNCMNHVTTNIEGRVKTWFAWKLWKHVRCLINHKGIRALVKWFMNGILANVP